MKYAGNYFITMIIVVEISRDIGDNNDDNCSGGVNYSDLMLLRFNPKSTLIKSAYDQSIFFYKFMITWSSASFFSNLVGCDLREYGCYF